MFGAPPFLTLATLRDTEEPMRFGQSFSGWHNLAEYVLIGVKTIMARAST
jgi:hypothetical protein